MNHPLRFRPLVATVCILTAFQLALSCASGPAATAGATGLISPADRALAQEQFESRCANCHGLDGMGNGPMAGFMDPSPRNWTDRVWQDSVDDDYLVRITAGGGEAVGLSSLMPGSPHANNQGFLRAMVEIIRTYRR